MVEKPPHHGAYGHNVADLLDSPLLQPILPAPYRRSLAARSPQASPPPEAGAVTLAVRTLMKAGLVLAGVGSIAFGFFVWRGRGLAPPRTT